MRKREGESEQRVLFAFFFQAISGTVCFGLRIALGLDRDTKWLGMSCKERIFHASEMVKRISTQAATALKAALTLAQLN
jgi:hypothetical protein